LLDPAAAAAGVVGETGGGTSWDFAQPANKINEANRRAFTRLP